MKLNIKFNFKVQHSCDQCNYKSNYKVELKIHIDSKHEGSFVITVNNVVIHPVVKMT